MMKKIKNALLISLCIAFSLILIYNSELMITDVHNVEAASSLQNPWDGLDFSPISDNYSLDSDYIYFSRARELATTTSGIATLQSSIIVIEDAYDFYRFSLYCNGSDEDGNTIDRSLFLDLDYVLGNDINYDEAAQERHFLKPIGSAYYPFTGTFNGQGFVIQRPYMAPISDDTPYDGVQCLAIFAYNAGTIHNVGVTNFIIRQSVIFEGITHASVLVGTNDGIVSHVYVIDDRANAGLNVEGVNLSGIVSINTTNGIFMDSYFSGNAVLPQSVSLIGDEQPVVSINNGIISNLYFDGSYAEIATSTDPGALLVVANNATSFNSSTQIRLRDVYGVSVSVGDYVINHEGVYQGQQNEINGITVLNTSEFLTSAFSTNYNQYGRFFKRNNYSGVTLNDTYPILKGIYVSGSNYLIQSPAQFAYMMTLIGDYGFFRNKTFLITECLDLNEVSHFAYQSPDVAFNGVLTSQAITSSDTCYANHPTDAQGAISNYHIIYNYYCDAGVTIANYNSYGLFAMLSGTVSHLNFVDAEIVQSDYASAVSMDNAFGMVTGILSGGRISDVHVQGDISIPAVATGIAHAKVTIGGLAGYATSNIETSSVSGAITASVSDGTNLALLDGSAIGGVVGHSDDAKLYQLYADVDITGIGFTSHNSDIAEVVLYIGGIVGSGTLFQAEGLIHDGAILSHPNDTYSATMYIGGLISVVTARNVYAQNIKQIINRGSMVLTVNNVMTAWMAGITTIAGSDSVELANSDYYSLQNDATISTQKNVTFGTTDSPNVDIKLSGVVIVEDTQVNLYGIYNNGDCTVDLSIVPAFAPCLNAKLDGTTDFGTDNTASIYIEQSYNTGDINVITTEIVPWYNAWTTGNIVGKNVSCNNVRNEGNITVHFSHDTYRSLSMGNNNYKHYKIDGIMEEISLDYTAENLYNGGNIHITMESGLTVKFCLYVAGIAYKNANTNVFSDPNAYTELNIDTELNGSLHNAINNGSIYSDGNFFGQSRLAGIVSVNASLLSSCFNLANIYNSNNVPQVSGDSYSSSEFEVETGGITFLMLGQYAQIKDSANYGTITSIDTNPSTTQTYGWVNASGIAVRNEKYEDGRDYGGSATTGSHFGKIEFTINYGDVYAWNNLLEDLGSGTGQKNQNITTTDYESQCKASGVLTLGVLSVLNVINYGNINSRYLSSGIFGIVFLNKFTIGTDEVYLANSINYGDIRRINGTEVPSYNSTTNTFNDVTSRLTTDNGKDTNYRYPVGGLIGYIYATGWQSVNTTSTSTAWNVSGTQYNIRNVNFSYLINFDETVDVIGRSTRTSATSYTGTTATSITNMNRYMATTSTNDTSQYPFSDVTSYTYDREVGGIFNEEFPLQTQPEGNDFYDIQSNRYIYEYIQFVPYSKVAPALASKIGLTSLVQSSAFIQAGYNADDVGIYALSSSLGIANGLFIPENIDLNALDPIQSDGESEITWRGDVNTTNTVMNKIYVQMRQIKASLATTVYDLQLITSSGPTYILRDPTIDTDNATITFYIAGNADEAYAYVEQLDGSYTPSTEPAVFVLDEYTMVDGIYHFSDVGTNYDYSDLISADYDITFVYDGTSALSTSTFILQSGGNSYTFVYDSTLNTYTCANLPNTTDNIVVSFDDGESYTHYVVEYNAIDADAGIGEYVYDATNSNWVLTGSQTYSSYAYTAIYNQNVGELVGVSFTEQVAPTHSGYIASTYNNYASYTYTTNLAVGTDYWDEGIFNYQTYTTSGTNAVVSRVRYTDSGTYYYASGTSTSTRTSRYFAIQSRVDDFATYGHTVEYLSGYIKTTKTDPDTGTTFDYYTYSTTIEPGDTYYTATVDATMPNYYYYDADTSTYKFAGPGAGTYVNNNGVYTLATASNGGVVVYNPTTDSFVIVGNYINTGVYAYNEIGYHDISNGELAALDWVAYTAAGPSGYVQSTYSGYTSYAYTTNIANGTTYYDDSIFGSVVYNASTVVSRVRYTLSNNIYTATGTSTSTYYTYIYALSANLAAAAHTASCAGYLAQTVTDPNGDSFTYYVYSTNIPYGTTYYLPTASTTARPMYYLDSSGNYVYAGPSNAQYELSVTSIPITNWFRPSSISFYSTSYPGDTGDYIVNLDSNSYLLAYMASLYADKVEDLTLQLGSISVPQFVGEQYKTSSVIRIYSEAYSQDAPNDQLTYRDYTIYIVRTADQNIDEVSSIIMNEETLDLTTEVTDNLYVTDDYRTLVDTIVSTRPVNYLSNNTEVVNPSIDVTYAITGIPDLLDLTDKIKLYVADGSGSVYFNGLAQAYTLVTDNYTVTGGITDVGEDYTDPISGIVSRVPYYNDATATWGSGNANYRLDFTQNLPGGEYIIALELSDSNKYLVGFSKELSSKAEVLELGFNDEEFTNTTSLTSYNSTILYGDYQKVIVSNLSDFTLNDYLYTEIANNLPSYLTNLAISPFSTLTNLTFAVSGTSVHTYTFTYTILAEDGETTGTFTHIITELTPSNDIIEVNRDGEILQDLTSPYVGSFAREDSPLYRITYDLTNTYTEDTSLITYTSATSSGPTGAVFGDNYSVNVSSDGAVEISFAQSSPVGSYIVNVGYSNAQSVNGANVTWNLAFDQVTITKNLSTLTLLSDIEFISDTVYTGLNTMIDTTIMDVEDYEYYLSEQLASLTIVCLPGSGIFYNGQDNQYDTYYVIGQVMRTNLIFYTPTFTLPNAESKIYRKLTTLDTVLDNNGDPLTIADMTSYYVDIDGHVYNLTDDQMVLSTNTAEWYTDFTYDSNSGQLSYVGYRVYAEDTNYYTDYQVAVQDIMNNVRFTIYVNFVDSATAAAFPSENVFVTLDYYGYDSLNIYTVNDYPYIAENLESSMSLFSHLDENDYGTEYGTNYTFTSSASGYYALTVAMPEGYTFEASNDSDLTFNVDTTHFKTRSSVVTLFYNLYITISADPVDPDWGVNNIINYDGSYVPTE